MKEKYTFDDNDMLVEKEDELNKLLESIIIYCKKKGIYGSINNQYGNKLISFDIKGELND